MSSSLLILPGLGDSGPDHWQTWLEGVLPGARRVRDIEWDVPILDRWIESLASSIRSCGDDVVVVAHSFGCLAAVRAAHLQPERIRALVLVAPADPLNFGLPDDGLDRALPVPSLLIASRNDPWMSYARAAEFAGHWCAELIDAGLAGHINVEAGFGPWPALPGLLRYASFKAAIRKVA
jgi:predicted alpha/beta hydrolase family esterase